jgi:flagellar basal body-associated protein FliL
MSKKNIIILVITLVVIALLLIIYQSDFLFKKTTDYGLEKNNDFPITSTEEDSDESSNAPSNETKTPNTGNISDEACIEILAYAFRIAESGLADPKILEYSKKIEELERKYGVDGESDYFNEYCNDRVGDNEVYEKIKEKMRELGSDIE